jgi:hypothetical protein
MLITRRLGMASYALNLERPINVSLSKITELPALRLDTAADRIDNKEHNKTFAFATGTLALQA